MLTGMSLPFFRSATSRATAEHRRLTSKWSRRALAPDRARLISNVRPLTTDYDGLYSKLLVLFVAVGTASCGGVHPILQTLSGARST
jgi:hypothetical protein